MFFDPINCAINCFHTLQLRQCLRRSTARLELHECVLTFSRASPHEACTSAKHLLECAVPSVESKCGSEAGQFEREYVGRFAKALDQNCSLDSNSHSSGESK